MDGYRWVQNGTKKLPRSDPVVSKTHFIAMSPSGPKKEFKRQVFRLLGNQSKVLIHYIGDESVACEFSHGNSKSGKIYHRTCKSVLKKIASCPDPPELAYKHLVGESKCPTQYQPYLLPRNTKQVSNVQYNERQKNRLSHDAMYNLHELAYDLGGFVKRIITYPDLIVIFGDSRMLQELDNILLVESKCPQLLSYDTTFQLGDFYLSPLLFRHTLFSESPVVPALFLLHERKFKSVHDEFMKLTAEVVPNLAKMGKIVPVVIDDEVGISQAIGSHLSQTKRVICWNHIINSVKTWLRKHGATSAEMPVYVSHVRELLCQDSPSSYEEKFKSFAGKWSQPFCLYFEQNIQPKVYLNSHRHFNDITVIIG